VLRSLQENRKRAGCGQYLVIRTVGLQGESQVYVESKNGCSGRANNFFQAFEIQYPFLRE
jgi:hypothetical protein